MPMITAVLVSCLLFQSSRQPIHVDPDGVPSGFSILGESATPPRGYAATGMTTVVSTGVAPVVMLPDAPVPREQAVAVSLGGKVYLIGGVDIQYPGPLVTPVLQIDVFDTTNNSWSTESAFLPSQRTRAAAFAWNSKILVFGGAAGSQSLDSVLEYDTVNGTVINRGPMPLPRAGHAAVAHQGRFFALGGWGNTNVKSVYEYYPQTDSWALRAPMISTPNSPFALLPINNSLLWIQGSTIDEYRIDSNSWTSDESGVSNYGWNFACSSQDSRNWLISVQNAMEFDVSARVVTPRSTGSRMFESAYASSEDRVYRMGGSGAGGNSIPHCLLFDLASTKAMHIFRKL